MRFGVKFGIDNLIDNAKPDEFGRIGLVTNDAAYTASGVRSREALLAAKFDIRKLFSPEHGISAKGADGAFIPNGLDLLTKLPIVSLYGDKLAPTQEDFADIDTVFFDIADIGLRYYTYLWTLSYVLEECAKNNTKLVVLDRPNPLSGATEGPMLDESNCSSFIGRWDVPIRHGCTLGELAKFFNSERKINADLRIIGCKNWQRNMFFNDWNLPFQPTSPAIASWACMLAYPITAFCEATNLSDGRGTSTPFLQIGATWLEGLGLSKLEEISQGVDFQYCRFTPTEGKFKDEVCSGIKVNVVNPEIYKPTLTGLCLIKTIKEQFSARFEWKPYPTRANPSGNRHMDLLTGISDSETLFELPWDSFLQKITALTDTQNWQKVIEKYKIYA
ncbi:MAG: exo-beta-N-acetylmuramidase NamZ domain-containing protein [Spirosomataceae bacterium]